MHRHFGRIAAGFVAAPFALWTCSSPPDIFSYFLFPQLIKFVRKVASAYQEQFQQIQKSTVVRKRDDYLIRQYFPYLKAEINLPAENYIEAFDRGLEQLDQCV
jgi:hypothetical protein